MVIESRNFTDARGSFAEIYRRSDFFAAGIEHEFLQDDHSTSVGRWVLRGLHHQVAPHTQGKLVRCVRGQIFDVAVDIREGSKTCGRWHGEALDARLPRMLWIPPGFAHGFLTLSDGAEVSYKHTAEYSATHARRIRWDDPTLAIEWPLAGATPIVAPEDANAAPFR